jgi:hypothetical protein
MFQTLCKLNLASVQSRLERQFSGSTQSFGWLINNEDTQFAISNPSKYCAVSVKSKVFILRTDRQQVATVENACPLEGERASSLLWVTVHDPTNLTSKQQVPSRTVLLVGTSEGYLRLFSADTTELLHEVRLHSAPLLKMKIESSFHFR